MFRVPIEKNLRLCSENTKRKRVNGHPLATDEAIDSTCPTRSPGGGGCFFLSTQARSLSLLGSIEWDDAALKPHAGRSDGYACGHRSSVGTRDVLIARVSLAVQCDQKNWACRRSMMC